MKFPSLHIGNTVVPVPIIQGGMGIGVSMSGLASAVAGEGAIGVISSADIGFKEDDFKRNTIAANLRAIGSEIKKAKEKAKSGLIGINIMSKSQDYEKYVLKAAQSGADLIFSGAGLPLDLPAIVKTYHTKIAPIVGSAKAARVILKMWDRHHHATADLVVVEGPKAGGHLGYTTKQIQEYTDDSYDKEIKNIIETVRIFEEKYHKKIPVIFGGGVFTQSDIEHYFKLGVSGVQMATRFVATKECDAAPAFKEMYIRARKTDITIVPSPVHMPGRALLNPFVKRLKEAGRIPPLHCFHCLKSCHPDSTPYCITQALIRAVQGDVDHGLIFCGANAWRIKKITTVHDLIHELVD